MLTIRGPRYRMCDGLSRRSFLQVGALGMGGLALPQLLQAESNSKVGSSHKSVIMIFLTGGPPHQDMIDLKPQAPREYRGEFKPINSNVPGIDIGELLPMMAQRMDKIVAIRSLVGSAGQHGLYQCLHGNPEQNQPPGRWPCFGSAASKLQGPINNEIPAAVSLQPKMGIPFYTLPGEPGFAGMAHAPFAPNHTGTADLALNGMTLDKLRNRRGLIGRLDLLRAKLDASDLVDGMNTYYQQAFDILTSGRLAEALDYEREPKSVRDRFGYGSKEPAGYGDAGWMQHEDMIVARRLIQAGARVVTLSFGRWDWHGQPHGSNFDNAREHVPEFDQAFTALLDDLEERSMLDDVSIVVWGEFGRTPHINPGGGRDHWPKVGMCLLAGGGMRTGQIIGATNSRAEHATERPVHYQDVFATLYHQLGIDVDHATINDLTGRPQYLVDHTQYRPMPEVI